MNQSFAARLAGLASVLVLFGSISTSATAQQPYYPVQPGAVNPYMPAQPYPMGPGAMPRPSYGYPYRTPYSAPYRAPYSTPYSAPYRAPAPIATPVPSYRPPVNNAPRTAAPRTAAPNRNRPMYGNPRFGGAPYRGFNRGSRSPIPFESNFTPWSMRFWDEMGDGGENPFKDMEKWIDFDEPREGMANAWEDMVNAPHEVGQMPGGWTAPSISVPNPVDVQKEFQETGKQIPDEMRTQMDNIDIQTW